MGRHKQKSPIEKILGPGVTIQWRIIEELLKQEEPIQQAELARKVGAREKTVSEILKRLVEDEVWGQIFKTTKKYGARIYWIEKEPPLTEKLLELRDVLLRIKEMGYRKEGSGIVYGSERQEALDRATYKRISPKYFKKPET